MNKWSLKIIPILESKYFLIILGLFNVLKLNQYSHQANNPGGDILLSEWK